MKIKFWNKEKRMMSHSYKLIEIMNMRELPNALTPLDKLIPLFYIGLKDRKGQEIYKKNINSEVVLELLKIVKLFLNGFEGTETKEGIITITKQTEKMLCHIFGLARTAIQKVGEIGNEIGNEIYTEKQIESAKRVVKIWEEGNMPAKETSTARKVYEKAKEILGE